VDPADFKSYVFPLLFFKWVSDTWNLDHAAAVKDFGEDVASEFEADYHRFTVPARCHWDDLKKLTVNVGVALQRILDRLAEANPETLAGIFGDVAWGNKERLPEPALLNLIDAFNRLTLNRAVVPNDMLGAAYEYLIRQFADESGKRLASSSLPGPWSVFSCASSIPSPERPSTTQPAARVECSLKPSTRFVKPVATAARSAFTDKRSTSQQRPLPE